MPRSRSNHPLALFRKAIGLRQKELAAFLGREEKTISAIERGERDKKRRPYCLSDDLASEAEEKLGVSAQSLVGALPGDRPLTKEGEPLTKEYFELYTAIRDAGELTRVGLANIYLSINNTLPKILAESADVLLAAIERGKYFQVEAQFARSIRQLKRKVGFDPDDSFAIDVVRRKEILLRDSIQMEHFRAYIHGALLVRIRGLTEKSQKSCKTRRERKLGKKLGDYITKLAAESSHR
jgi:transcriptional regulator with XRE-family HTH domain